MNISLTPHSGVKHGSPLSKPSQTQTEATKSVEQIKDGYADQASIHNGSREIGNTVSKAFTGVVGHLGGNLALVPKTVVSTYQNLWKAETIGKYAKTVGSVVALAGIPLVAAGAILSSPLYGIGEARKGGETQQGPLVSGSTADVADRISSKEDGPDTLMGKAIQNMEEFGNKKLKPGEEPWDIPIDKIGKWALDKMEFLMVKVPVQAYKIGKAATKAAYRAGKTAVKETYKFGKTYLPKLAGAAVAGVTSALIAGPAGLAMGVVLSAAMMARDIKDAVVELNPGKALKSLAYLPVGPVMAGISVKENFGRSFVEGWEGKPLQAIKTTGKAVIANAKEIWENKGKKEGQ